MTYSWPSLLYTFHNWLCIFRSPLRYRLIHNGNANWKCYMGKCDFGKENVPTFFKMLFLCLNRMKNISVSKVVMVFLLVLFNLLLLILFSEGNLTIPGCCSWVTAVLKPYLYLACIFMLQHCCLVSVLPFSIMEACVCTHRITSWLEKANADNRS